VPAAELAALGVAALLGLLPIITMLGLSSAALLAVLLTSSCVSPVLLQLLLQQENEGVLTLAAHLQGWGTAAELLHTVLIMGRPSAMAPTFVNLSWLLAHSLVVMGHEVLRLVLLRDTSALTAELYATLALTPYPAVWAAITSHSLLQRWLCIFSAAGTGVVLLVVLLLRTVFVKGVVRGVSRNASTSTMLPAKLNLP